MSLGTAAAMDQLPAVRSRIETERAIQGGYYSEEWQYRNNQRIEMDFLRKDIDKLNTQLNNR